MSAYVGPRLCQLMTVALRSATPNSLEAPHARVFDSHP
jgi:hypothetical protein